MTSSRSHAWTAEKMANGLKAHEPQGDGPTRAVKTRNALKAMVIAACASFAIRQVVVMVGDYLSVPTATSYKLHEKDTVPAPAFTICPKLKKENDSTWKLKDLTSLSLADVVQDATYGWMKKSSTFDGENITLQNNTGHWSEQQFFDIWNHHHYKCFTLFSNREMYTGAVDDLGPTFVFDYNAAQVFNYSKIEVFVHDQGEKFSNLRLLEPEKFVVFKNTDTNLFIHPEVSHRLSTKDNPCSTDEGYSHTRCIEKCFMDLAASRPDMPCLKLVLQSNETDQTREACRNQAKTFHLAKELSTFVKNEVLNLSKSCECPRRCILTDYRIFGDPAPIREREKRNGTARLFLSFPSRRVPHFREVAKVTLEDLLSNIGGIVGACLGVSLITLFDIIDYSCKCLQGKLFPR